MNEKLKECESEIVRERERVRMRVLVTLENFRKHWKTLENIGKRNKT